jgi:methyl-accepting chemotaxis protein
MRSAEAAKNTSAMIEESVQNSRNGVTIAGEVGKMLEEITGASAKVNALIGEIAAASQEQSQGIGQVNTAMMQVDKVTQSNAATAEESASASKELADHATQMAGVVENLMSLVGIKDDQSETSRQTAERNKPYTVASVSLKSPKVSKQSAKAKCRAAIPLEDAPVNGATEAGFEDFDLNKAA